MNNKTRLKALSAFLKAKRAQISPESIGLSAGNRRRTPGYEEKRLRS